MTVKTNTSNRNARTIDNRRKRDDSIDNGMHTSVPDKVTVAPNPSTASSTKPSRKKTKKSDDEDIEKMLVKYTSFNAGDILWAKMRGFPLWPCKVCCLYHKIFMLKFILKIFNTYYSHNF